MAIFESPKLKMVEGSLYQQLFGFTSKQLLELDAILSAFTKQSGVNIAIVAHTDGQIISCAGACSKEDSFVIGTLASACFAASSAAYGELEPVEKHTLQHYLLEGSESSIYISAIGKHDKKFLWLCTFANLITIGEVRKQSEKACQLILKIAGVSTQKHQLETQLNLDKNFGKHLELEIADLFSTFDETQ